MAGRPDFSTPGSQGSGQTVAVQSRPEVTSLNEDQTSNVSAGSTEAVEVYAPAGSVYKTTTIRMHVNAEGTATTGNHEMRVQTAGGTDVMKGNSQYTGEIRFNQGFWITANNYQRPSHEAATAQLMQGILATENAPLAFYYKNNTDAAQTNKRTYRTVVTEESY